MADEATKPRKFGLMSGVALIVGLLLGAVAMAVISPAPTPAPEKTFTVVAYHWGFAIYDENGVEVPKIEVAKGTEVTVLVIGAEALSHAIHHEYEERTINAWADNAAYGGLNATEIEEAIEDAEAIGLEDHGFTIPAYSVDVKAEGDSPAPAQVTFVADTAGTFDIVCNVNCGFGHAYMTLVGGFVVT